jgi:hypothetical protein
VRILGIAVAVGNGRGVSEGTTVASGCAVANGSPQAVISRRRIKRKDARAASLLVGFMRISF